MNILEAYAPEALEALSAEAAANTAFNSDCIDWDETQKLVDAETQASVDYDNRIIELQLALAKFAEEHQWSGEENAAQTLSEEGIKHDTFTGRLAYAAIAVDGAQSMQDCS